MILGHDLTRRVLGPEVTVGEGSVLQCHDHHEKGGRVASVSHVISHGGRRGGVHPSTQDGRLPPSAPTVGQPGGQGSLAPQLLMFLVCVCYGWQPYGQVPPPPSLVVGLHQTVTLPRFSLKNL